ncbi:MAG: photosystem II stability/assembly factor-like uncharacterized protein [Flavobacteriaceae bacterium]|jgi:photosystem II stability/assembly factor-like uncharacterized protein
MKYTISIFLSLFLVLSLTAQTWDQIGPEGGYFKEFTIHPVDPNTIYAGSDDGGGVWKSIDSGDTWSLTTSDFPNMTGWKIVIDENSPNTVYSCDLYGRYGLLKSVDGGTSWSLINSGLSTIYDKMVSGLVVKTSDTLFVSTGESAGSVPVRPGNGMYKSFDGGLTWTASGLQGKTIPSVGKNEFGTIFAGSEDFGLYYSNDNGTTWLTHPDIPAAGTVFEIDTDSNVILLASSEGIFLSTNWGINFVTLGLAGEFNFDACIHTTLPDIEIYSSTLTGLKHYSSATSTWNTVVGSFFSDQFVIGITSDGSNVFCGGFSNSPIVKSVDGGTTWNELVSSPTATELTDIFIDQNNSDRIVTCLMGTYHEAGSFDRESIYESTNGGASWIRKGPDAHALCLAANPLNSQTLYLGSFAQGVYKTDDSFNSFTQLSPDSVAVVDVIVSAEDTNVVFISEIDFTIPTFSIKRSSDAGNNFNQVSTIIANRLMFNPNNNDTIYVATNNGVSISVDFGLTFSPWVLAGEDCRTLAVKGNDVFTGTTDGKLFKIANSIATDISGTWDTPVEIKSVYTLGEELFVGMNGAEKDTFMVLQGSIWRTMDDGGTWSDITTDMTSTNIYGNNIIASDGSELFVGTYGGGLFKSSGLGLDAGLNDFESDESLSVYPNPVEEVLTINLEGNNYQNLEVIDILGEDVTNRINYVNDVAEDLAIDVSRLEIGVYVIQFHSGDKIYTAKFIKN